VRVSSKSPAIDQKSLIRPPKKKGRAGQEEGTNLAGAGTGAALDDPAAHVAEPRRKRLRDAV
jgi:hypothetical protein